ncbi:MAG: putative glycosyltransferase EpsE [Deltaproteobacteria bacterium ADurb.Bin022]|nr:MAG: putative glycosyltransferase EpsE [Deltaproteobacteria bacterium ADurb.Bin022]HOG82077.1 glycosyltransferase [Smithellaceae bacterium]
MNMVDCPKVTVIIPCYNMGQYIDEAVDSVFAQTMQNFEIIIVDDGSTDQATTQLLSNYHRPNTRVLVTENQGLAAARNHAIRHANGEYLCALDSDDKLHPTYFEHATSRLDSDPALTFVSSWVQMFGTSDALWKQDTCDLPTLLSECTVMTPALVRADAVRSVGGYDTQMPDQGDEDWDLWISLAERGYRGTIIPEILFYYRRRPGSMCEVCTTGETHLRLVRYIMGKHRESYQKHFTAVLNRKQADVGGLLHENYALERHISDRLQPIVESRKKEVERLQAKRDRFKKRPKIEAYENLAHELEAAKRQLDEKNMELQRYQTEVHELRTSGSWRITAPIRAVYDVWLGIKGK